MLTMFVLLPILVRADINLPMELKDKEVQYFKLLLTENKSRVVVIIRSSDYCDYYEQVFNLVTKYYLPYYSIEANSIKKFNGLNDLKFSYKAIVDESRLYLVFISNITSAKDMVPKLLRIYFFRPRHRIALIINKSNNTAIDILDIRTLFQIYWQKEILNIVLVVKPFQAYIYRPYKRKFSIYVNGTGQELFPKRFIDLRKNVLRLSTFRAALDCWQTKSGAYIGRDVDVWSTIAESMNATFAHIPTRDNITYGLKFSNKTMTGVFRDVVENYTDLTANSRMVKLQFENLMEGTYPHDREDVSILVPSADKIEEFSKFVNLFSLPLWILIIACTTIFGIIWWLINNRKHPIKAFLDSYSLTLGYPLKEPINMNARFLLLIYVTYIFFIQAAYHGLLSSVLTIPIVAPEINTIQQLDDSNLKIYAAARFKDMLQANIGGTVTQSFVEKLQTVPDDPDIEKVVKKRGHYAVLQKETFAVDSILKRENFREDGTPIYRIIKEKPMPTQVCYAGRYGSPLIPIVNVFLRRFQEAGLDKHWKTITIHKIMLEQKLGELPTPVSLKVLTLENIAIAFVGLLFGYILAFIILLCEKCSHYTKK